MIVRTFCCLISPPLERCLLKIPVRVSAVFLAAALMVGHVAAGAAQDSSSPAKKKVNSANDLPRFSYPISTPPSVLLMADEASFNAFARKVLHDIDSVLNEYDIPDKATLRQLYATKLNIEVLTNENETAAATSKSLRALQDKPQARAASGMLDRPLIEARLGAHASSGDAFFEAFRAKFQENLDALDWKLIQDRVKGMKRSFEIASPDLIAGSEKEYVDPAAAKSNTVDLPAAETLIEDRYFIHVVYPLKAQVLPILSAYIAAHNVHKPDIWAVREVTLTAEQKLTPVRIGIWDSGVDTTLFPNQLFTDPSPGAHSPHGLAFDANGDLFNGDLQPLTDEQKALYPKIVGLEQGLDDLFNSIDSSAAADARKTLSSMPRDKAAGFLRQMTFLFQYLHGTHVAGIAMRGNPAARIVVAQFFPDQQRTRREHELGRRRERDRAVAGQDQLGEGPGGTQAVRGDHFQDLARGDRGRDSQRAHHAFCLCGGEHQQRHRVHGNDSGGPPSAQSHSCRRGGPGG